MGVMAGMAAASVGVSMLGTVLGAREQRKAAFADEVAAETSKILEAAFFDDEVGGIIAESARLVGAAEAEAGARGVKSTTGTAAARVAEIRRAGSRELRTAAQETVLVRHGLEQAGIAARRAGSAARLQGGLAVAGQALQGASSMYSDAATGRYGKKTSDWVGRL